MLTDSTSPRPRPSAARSREIRLRFTLGETMPMLAKEFGITKGRVWQIIHEVGLTRQSGGSHVQRQKSRDKYRERDPWET